MATSNPDRYAAVGRDGARRTDWVAWHAAYDDPQGSLARRLVEVRRLLERALSETSAATVLSLCAGDGRDVIGVCRSTASRPARAVLVELDVELADRARSAAAGIDEIEVRCADAADPATIADVAPVDVLLLVGIFGNVAPESVDPVVARCRPLVVPGGSVIWTRGGGDPDRRQDVRDAFGRNGFIEVEFTGAPATFGVGYHRAPDGPAPDLGDRPIFEFVR